MGIKNSKDFEDFVGSKQIEGTALASMSADDLAFFKAQLKFSDAGFPGGYWGDIVRDNSMSESDLGDFVSGVFGVDKEEFLKCLHYFGQTDGTCVPRQYWNCPYC